MSITSVGAPISGLNNYSVSLPPSSQGGATAVAHVTESSQVHLSPEAKQLNAQAMSPSTMPNSNSTVAPVKESSSWFDDALDSILPDDPDDSAGTEDDCSCTVGKYLKAAASIGSVIALFA